MSTVLATFRDPEGFVVVGKDRVFRYLHPEACARFELLSTTLFIKKARREGRLIDAEFVSSEMVLESLGSLPEGSGGGRWLSHPKVFMPTYGQEWSNRMLWEAANLTLDLALASLDEGYVLKDASIDNILFNAEMPIFVDSTSFSLLDKRCHVWKAQAQFERMFLLPLLIVMYANLTCSQIFKLWPKGVGPEEAAGVIGVRGRWDLKVFRFVKMPILFNRWAERYSWNMSKLPIRGGQEDLAVHILKNHFIRLKKILKSLKPRDELTRGWSNYNLNTNNYEKFEAMAKEDFLRRALEDNKPKTVMDLGANTGHYSRIVASFGARVVAVDGDAASLANCHSRAHEYPGLITSMVMDLSAPTGGQGWLNQEKFDFLSRIQGRFDLVLALALVHHLLVTEQIPLPLLAYWMNLFAAKSWVIEWVDPMDSNFKKLVRGRDDLFASLSMEAFEEAVSVYFIIQAKKEIRKGLRWLYLLAAKKKINI